MNPRIPAYYSSSQWRSLRNRILTRDKWVCQYCGDHAEQVDHVRPRSAGGADKPFNLVACCANCNCDAGGKVFPSFEAKKAYLRSILPKTHLSYPGKKSRRERFAPTVPKWQSFLLDDDKRNKSFNKRFKRIPV